MHPPTPLPTFALFLQQVKHDPVAEVERRARETLEAGEGKDLPSPADAVVETVGAGWDEGYGELLMWRVHPRGLVTVPEEEFGHLHSSHRWGNLVVIVMIHCCCICC